MLSQQGLPTSLLSSNEGHANDRLCTYTSKSQSGDEQRQWTQPVFEPWIVYCRFYHLWQAPWTNKDARCQINKWDINSVYEAKANDK